MNIKTDEYHDCVAHFAVNTIQEYASMLFDEFGVESVTIDDVEYDAPALDEWAVDWVFGHLDKSPHAYPHKSYLTYMLTVVVRDACNLIEWGVGQWRIS